jgi:hypothetical protein
MSNTLWPAPVQSVLQCKIPHELDALKWKGIGRRQRFYQQTIHLNPACFIMIITMTTMIVMTTTMTLGRWVKSTVVLVVSLNGQWTNRTNAHVCATYCRCDKNNEQQKSIFRKKMKTNGYGKKYMEHSELKQKGRDNCEFLEYVY